MTTRFDITRATPDLYKTLLTLKQAVAKSGIDERLFNLIKVRVSQVNGCAFCVDMHIKEAIGAGISEKTIHMLTVWRETEAFSRKERAALAWAESVTLLTQTHAPDDVYEAVEKEFSEREIAQLTIATAEMNLWNRLGVGARMTV